MILMIAALAAAQSLSSTVAESTKSSLLSTLDTSQTSAIVSTSIASTFVVQATKTEESTTESTIVASTKPVSTSTPAQTLASETPVTKTEKPESTVKQVPTQQPQPPATQPAPSQPSQPSQPAPSQPEPTKPAEPAQPSQPAQERPQLPVQVGNTQPAVVNKVSTTPDALPAGNTTPGSQTQSAPVVVEAPSDGTLNQVSSNGQQTSQQQQATPDQPNTMLLAGIGSGVGIILIAGFVAGYRVLQNRATPDVETPTGSFDRAKDMSQERFSVAPKLAPVHAPAPPPKDIPVNFFEGLPTLSSMDSGLSMDKIYQFETPEVEPLPVAPPQSRFNVVSPGLAPQAHPVQIDVASAMSARDSSVYTDLRQSRYTFASSVRDSFYTAPDNRNSYLSQGTDNGPSGLMSMMNADTAALAVAAVASQAASQDSYRDHKYDSMDSLADLASELEYDYRFSGLSQE